MGFLIQWPTLIALGTGVAYGYSVIAVVAPGLFPDVFRTTYGTVPIYFEAAAVIVTLVLLGQVLELRARSHTSAAGPQSSNSPMWTHSSWIKPAR